MCDEWKGPDANTGWVFEMIGEKMDYEWEVVRGPQHRLVSVINYESYHMSHFEAYLFETLESIFTGPRIDHTRKSVYGRYLYASGLESEGGDFYVIQSPYLDLSYSQGSHGYHLVHLKLERSFLVHGCPLVRLKVDPDGKYKKLPWILVS